MIFGEEHKTLFTKESLVMFGLVQLSTM